ncbi:MAG: molybdenum cofactor guanylyltransferase [Candidatus Krumholzibacteriia bacterium]
MTRHDDLQLDRRQVAAYILAGGASWRMGADKARLILDGTPVVRVLAARLSACVSSVELVVKRSQERSDLGLPLLYDDADGRALVIGIRTALTAPGPPWRFILACDMPGVDAAVLRALWRTAQDAGASGSCPQRYDRQVPEPLPSLWHARLALQMSAEWGMAAKSWVRHAGLAVWHVPESGSDWFANVNTRGEWERYRRRVEPTPSRESWDTKTRS